MTDTWSGAVVYAPSKTKMLWVIGQWMVPNPYPGLGDGTWYASSWIGIDGDGGSNDVFQAGVQCEAIVSGGITTRNIYAWWEWYPDDEVMIPNFPIFAGDGLHCVLCAESDTTGSVFLYNVSAGVYTSFKVTAGIKAGVQTTLVGNCAEWIVERPLVNKVAANLADYGFVSFDVATAQVNHGPTLVAGSGNNINMTDARNNIISRGTNVNDNVKCTYVRR